MSKSMIVFILLMGVALTGSPVHSQGRGPQGPPPQGQGRGFPGGPPSVSPSRRPADVGRPADVPQADRRNNPNGVPVESPPSSTASSVFDQVGSKPQLAERLTQMLPEGMAMEDATADFSNLGGFVSTLHVANNLGVPFADLKASMIGEGGLSLGQAIQANGGPNMTPEGANEAASEAEEQAEQLIDETQ